LPHHRTVTTNSEHYWGQPSSCGSRNYQSPVPQSQSTATRIPGDLGCTFRHLYGSKCSSPSTICRTQAPEQQRSWSHSDSCGQACRRIAAPGHALASPASAPKSPTTQSLLWATLHRQQPQSSLRLNIKPEGLNLQSCRAWPVRV
jgi:hypothetical protein